MTEVLSKPFWRRFLTGFSASSILVLACSLSMQLHVLRDPQWLGIVALGIAIASIPGSAIAALLFRRSELMLVLGAQLLTVSALITWFAVRA